MISGYDYDPDRQVLHIQFRNSGEIFSYEGVPEALANDFINSPSKGKFFNSNIKNQFREL